MASFLQFGYNSGNALYTAKTETELLADLALRASAVDEDCRDWSAIKNSVLRSAPEAQDVLEPLAKLAGLFDPKTAQELHNLSLRWGENRKLGCSFLEALAHVKFRGGKPNIGIRKALMAANLTAKKTEDGFSRLVYKTDLVKFSKDPEAADLAEDSICYSEGVIKTLISKGQLNEKEGNDCQWRFAIRAVLFPIGRGPDSFDQKSWGSHAEIQQSLINELSSLVSSGGLLTAMRLERG